jgi:N-methylhydantoinase B/oxoprolinase/acetone carboxylase alpha subunit
VLLHRWGSVPPNNEKREKKGYASPSQRIINIEERIERSKREKIHEQVKHPSARAEDLRATPP